MSPFWAVARLTAEQLKDSTAELRFNAELIHKEFMVVTVGNVDGKSTSITYAVTVPVITNAVVVAKGHELVMEVVPKTVSAKRKEIGWKDDAKRTKTCNNKVPKSDEV